MTENISIDQAAKQHSNSSSSLKDSSLDAFYRGKFYLYQPKAHAYRAGLDAMLLASAVPRHFKGKLADFGAGSGAAAFAVASKAVKSYISLIEDDDLMLSYAQKSALLNEQYNKDFAKRLSFYRFDLNAPLAQLDAIGLKPHSFDFIIMNPPYNNITSYRPPKGQKAAARLMGPNLLSLWLHKACYLLKAKGSLALILRPASLNIVLRAIDKRFGAIKLFPISPYHGKGANRLLITAKRDSQTPLSLEPALYLRSGPNGALQPFIEKLCNGDCDLADSPPL